MVRSGDLTGDAAISLLGRRFRINAKAAAEKG
jgi:hypothetical protein